MELPAAVKLHTDRDLTGATGTRGTPDFKKIKGLAFDAYGTLYDVHSVIELGEQLFPGHGTALSNAWRLKQLQYTWQRSLMERYADFWKVTEDGLVFASNSLNLKLDPNKRKQLMDAYLSLRTFPDVPPGLKELSAGPSSEYLAIPIEPDYRSSDLRIGPMLGFNLSCTGHASIRGYRTHRTGANRFAASVEGQLQAWKSIPVLAARPQIEMRTLHVDSRNSTRTVLALASAKPATRNH